MTYLTKAVLWFFLGPIASLLAGYLVFLLFGFILGAGVDLDGRGSSIQTFFGGLAIPALVVVAVGGSITSIVFAICCFLRDRASTAEAGPSDRRLGEHSGRQNK